MAELLLLRHDYDGKRLTLTGRVAGPWSGKRLRAALLPPPGAPNSKPLAEEIVAPKADGTFSLSLSVETVAFGTRLELVDPDDGRTFWIGSGAALPTTWLAGAVPIDLPGVPTGPGTPGIPDPPGGGPPITLPPWLGGLKIPCFCALMPWSCTTLLGLWKSLLLAALGLWYVALVLAPPDWGVRMAVCIIMDEALKAARVVRVTATAPIGAAPPAAVTTAVPAGATGAIAGTLGGPVGTVAGGAGGAGLGALVGGIASGVGSAATSAAGELAEGQFGRTLRAIFGLIDGMVAMLGWFLHMLAELTSVVALAFAIIWFICCARGDRCRLIANLAWVLEATIIVVLPVLGVGVGFLAWLITFLPPAACARVGTQWFLEIGGGLLLGTIVYGFVRWLRDKGRCPVLILWQWPSTENTP